MGFNRPYGKYCQILDAPLSTGSGEWFLWEFPFAFWIEQHGYDVTFIANADIHRDAAGLLRARGILSVGHDEYWTIEMFRNVQAAIASGVRKASSGPRWNTGRSSMSLRSNCDGTAAILVWIEDFDDERFSFPPFNPLWTSRTDSTKQPRLHALSRLSTKLGQGQFDSRSDVGSVPALHLAGADSI